MHDKNFLKIIWFRNDLRLHNNKNIEDAYSNSSGSLSIFVLDENILTKDFIPDTRLSFLYESLINLNKSLETNSSKLLLLKGKPYEIFSKISKSKAVKIFASKGYSSFSQKRDNDVKNKLEGDSELILTKNNVIYDFEDNILNKEGLPYKVFTQFKIQWLKKLKDDLSILDFENKFNFLEKKEVEKLENEFRNLGIEVVDIKDLSKLRIISDFHGGEDNARKEWKNFFKDKVQNYNKYRNQLDLEGTSKLSPHYKFGTLSVYEVVRDCIEVLGNDFDNFKKKQSGINAGVESYLSEIIWREFYKYILAHFPNIEKEEFQEKYRKIRWSYDKESFKSWSEGKTGYPIVDACMRQLNQTGWMHNRGRMIVASFLCKDLQIDWKWGEKYFRSKLIDYDISANNGGWQWTAGVGTDAAPYFRIFNPIEQGLRHDPDGKFTKKFLPELKDVPIKYLFEPWEMSDLEQIEANIVIGKDYPKPIIDHKVAREKTLKMYKME